MDRSLRALLPRRACLIGLGAAFLTEIAAPRVAAADIPLVGRPKGRPHIKIERLSVPDSLAGGREYVEHLERTLRRESRRANWGVGASSTIALRFAIERLSLERRGNVLEVRCSALGELPERRTARSQLSFGGDARQEKRLVLQVLDIVVRGVVSRLADIERERRSR